MRPNSKERETQILAATEAPSHTSNHRDYDFIRKSYRSPEFKAEAVRRGWITAEEKSTKREARILAASEPPIVNSDDEQFMRQPNRSSVFKAEIARRGWHFAPRDAASMLREARILAMDDAPSQAVAYADYHFMMRPYRSLEFKAEIVRRGWAKPRTTTSLS